MKLEVGKTYKTRDGEIATVSKISDFGDWPVHGYLEGNSQPQTWTLEGYFYGPGESVDGRDIVSELKELRLEVGKKYMTRGGEVATIVAQLHQENEWPFEGRIEDVEGLSWTPDGIYTYDWSPSDDDLVSEYVEPRENPQWTPEEIARITAPQQTVQFTDDGPKTIPCLLPEDSAARKDIPVVTGVLDYFPLAIAAVAELSKLGNDKHNPGEPLHWARGKSTDHADCIGRHLIDRGRFAEDGTRHTAALAWRALALLQEELEAERGLGHVSR